MVTVRRFQRSLPLVSVFFLLWSAVALGLSPLGSERALAVSLGGDHEPLRDQPIVLFDGQAAGARQVRTDGQGMISLAASDAANPLSALYLLSEQPSARHPGGIKTYARGALRGGQLAFDPQQTLTTFDVTISLEWQPGNNEQELANLANCGAPASENSVYLKDIAAAMQSAASYLYDLTDGQMTFGTVTVYTGGEAWDKADIRILASNDYRPTALIGGIVDAPKTVPNADGSLSLTFRPGQIFLGRLWDGTTGRCGPWSASAGARTIVHEWLHYALNLWDEYQQPESGSATYCAANDLPLFSAGANASSAMAYHYTADALWRGDIAGGRAAPLACLNTDQMLVHNRSDWETIKAYFPAIRMPDLTRGSVPGPIYTGTTSVNLGSADATEATTSATVRVTTPISPALQPQSYMVIPRAPTNPLPRRILGQGALWPNAEATFFGVQNDATARIQLFDPRTNQRTVFPSDDRVSTPLQPGKLNDTKLANSSWQPDLQLIPVLDQNGDVVALRVVFQDCSGIAKRVQMIYCPAGGDCGEPVFVSLLNGVFEQVLTPPGGGLLPFYGYVYVRDPETGAWTTTWYQLGGGVGPAHADGHVPVVDGAVATAIPVGSLAKGEQTATLYMPAQRCFMPILPQNVNNLLGEPLEVQLVRGERSWSASDPPISVRFNYNLDLAARLGVRATDLSLISFDSILNANSPRIWAEVPVAGRNNYLGWLGVDSAKVDGGLRPLDGRLLFAIGYNKASGADQNHRLLLPAVRK